MRILNSNEVVKEIGLSKVTVWRMERAGLFPKRINLSDRRVGWAESEIEDWLEWKHWFKIYRRFITDKILWYSIGWFVGFFGWYTIGYIIGVFQVRFFE